MYEGQQQPQCHHSDPLPLLFLQCLPTPANPAVLLCAFEVMTTKVLFHQHKSNSVPPCTTVHQGLLCLSLFPKFSRFPLQDQASCIIEISSAFSQSYFGTYQELYAIQGLFFKLSTPNTHLLTLA